MRKPKIQWRHVAPVVLSVIAVAVSAAGLYIQSMYGSASLSMQLTGFTIEQHGNADTCTLDIALFNSGNRDTALLRVGLRQGKTVKNRDGTMTRNYAEYFPDTDPPGYVDAVVKGGDIKLLTLVFSSCNVAAIETGLKQGGLNQLSLATDAVNYDGKRSSVSTSFASVSVSSAGELTFVTHLAGQFDLLDNGTYHAGEAKGQIVTMSIDKDGGIHTNTTSSK